MSDPREDQLIEVVQQLVQQVGQNAADPGEINDDCDIDEEVVQELREEDIVDRRALLHLKLEPVPSDAASFRTWKNGFKVQLSKLDTSGQGLVLAWVSRGFDAERADLSSETRRLGCGRIVVGTSSELEQDITAYIGRCGQLGQWPKGRVMLSIIARHYDLDRVRGSVLTASTLFQIELGGSLIRDLRDFVVLFSAQFRLGNVLVTDDRLTGEWLFHRVKHIRKLERVIEDIRESGASSY